MRGGKGGRGEGGKGGRSKNVSFDSGEGGGFEIKGVFFSRNTYCC